MTGKKAVFDPPISLVPVKNLLAKTIFRIANNIFCDTNQI